MLAALATRRPLRPAISLRALATSYVPPASLQNVADAPPPSFRRPLKKTKPVSPSFYTSRASYYDHLYQLETALQRSRRALSTLELLPLPAFARASLPPAQRLWRNRQSLAPMFSNALTTARYRRMIAVLADLEECARIASAAGHTPLAESIKPVLALFERQDKDDVLARAVRKHVPLDRYGRSYTVGKRKESAARVWMIPVREPTTNNTTTAASPVSTSSNSDADLLAPVVNDAFAPSLDAAASRVHVTPTAILVNNVPINKFFAATADRECVVRPLKLAGVLGAFNVFAIVRGGGTTGQAGAIAHGIAQGIVAHVPEVDPILRKGGARSISLPVSTLTPLSAKLMKRDPRMVERKKTGMAKARKRVSHLFPVHSSRSDHDHPFQYAWVKR
jgi:small subunit ribosomal protein S9